MKFLKSLLLIPLLLIIAHSSNVYGFGKNKVIYKNFKWRYIQSKHFDVYFYDGGRKIAEFTAEVAESAYVQINRDFRYDIRERIVFIVYKSHNDWQQTNVVISYLEEGIGGVTELYKNRIVVPFEGNYEQFRHVIHHELVHAVMNDMLYGGSIQSLLVGEVTPAPLWFSEGLAEFQSSGWATQIDMIARDAVLNGYMPDLRLLEYYLVYQGGASVFKYIATVYGRKKIGELLQKMRGKVSFERVLQSSIGMDYEEFTERWHRYLRKQYWPEVADRKEPVEIAGQLTFHDKIPNYLNVSPAISPNGDKIAFISDRSGYQNIYLMSALDGRILKTLVKGQRSESFEELHWLRPGMSFSPDGRKVIFAAKSGEKDAIYTVDVKNGKINKYKIDLDGVFTAKWSPDGQMIAFIGNKDERSDVFILNLQTKEVVQLTDDVFTDDHPSWSPDSRKIAFVSDRKNYLDGSRLPEDFTMNAFDYEKRDIYILDVASRKIERITDTPWEESTPIFSPDGNTIAYTSYQNGISNIFLYKLESGESYPITNIISGIFQINWDRNANKLVFTTFFNGGFDIFIMNNPLELSRLELTDTQFRKDMNQEELPVYARNWQPSEGEKPPPRQKKIQGTSATDYSKFVFTNQKLKEKGNKKDGPITLAENNYQDENGNYKVHRYKLKFSPDLVTGTAGYDVFFGFSGYTAFAFSDLLGDHKIYLNINLVSDLKNSSLSLFYLNLKRRINWGIGGYHQAWFFRNFGNDFQRYRNYGINLLMAYPFSKFNRLEFNLNWYNVVLEYLTFPLPDERITTILPSLSYVHDSVLWGFTGPVDGSRYAFSYLASPKYSSESLDFQTVSFDYRKYHMLNRNYNLAFRLSGGASFGENPERFFLGGLDNWINYKSRVGNLRTNNISDVFFSRFVTPLRGSYFYEKEGSRYLLSNFEFRFPLIQFLGLGFPPLRLFNIRGTMFYDIGTAFFPDNNSFLNSSWRATQVGEDGKRRFKDIVSGYGVGARVFFLYFLVRIDVAWRFDLEGGSSKPIWYFSLGGDL
jgi:Tol biopolymer transport system component